MNSRRKFIKNTISSSIGGYAFPYFIIKKEEYFEKNENKFSFQEAQELHDECLIFDAHNDTPVERIARRESVFGLLKLNKEYHTDFPRMKMAGYNGGSFIIGNGVVANVWKTLQQTLSLVEQNEDKATLVYSSEDFISAKKNDVIGIVLSIEGIAKWIMGDVDILHMLIRNGVRWISISHGEGSETPDDIFWGLDGNSKPYKARNGVVHLQGSRSPYTFCTPTERSLELKNAIGLTDFGRAILKLNNELGIVTDLAHINDRAFFDVLDHTSKPVVASHTSVFSLCNHTRNLTDDQIKALAENGGVVGIWFLTKFLSDNKNDQPINSLMKNLAYVADLVGIEHVGIGTDYDGGVDDLVIDDMTKLLKITHAMLEFGFSRDEIKKIWGGNFVRILEQNMG